MNYVEKVGNDIEEMITSAIIELGITRDEASVKVIEEGKKGLFGLGAKKSIIQVSKKINVEDHINRFLHELFYMMNVEVNIKIRKEDENTVFVDITGGDLGFLIGKQGAYLESLQQYINLAVNKDLSEYHKVVIDIGEYKVKRKETLEALAEKMANKVIKDGEKVYLNPMNAYERKVVHAYLQDNSKVSTYSEGEGLDRKVVIELKN